MATDSFRSILAATNLSPESDESVQAAARLAAASDAQLHLFHCVPMPTFPFAEGLVDEETRKEWEAGFQKLQAQTQRVLGSSGNAINLSASVGAPAAAILDEASAHDANLIVLGRHRPRAVLDTLLGTTADRVIRTASEPCLVVNRELRTPLRHVLLPTDFSETARRALRLVLAWLDGPLKSACSHQVVVEVLFVSAFASPSARPVDSMSLLEQKLHVAREHRKPDSHVQLVPRTVSAPLAIDGILETAAVRDTGLIALGTHGHGALIRALIGSVTAAVARMAAHPVLLVPPNVDQAEMRLA